MMRYAVAMKSLMSLRHRIKNWRNPHNETRLHLAALTRRYGFSIGEFSYGRPRSASRSWDASS